MKSNNLSNHKQSRLVAPAHNSSTWKVTARGGSGGQGRCLAKSDV